MRPRHWLGFAALALIALVATADAQTFKAWPNDQLGRPAPPCMVLDPATGTTTPCSSTTPLPTSGSGAGVGTTTGTSETGFGKSWYPSAITGAVGSGQQMIGIFISDTQVAIFRRSTGCGNCLQVAVSADGGVTGTFVSTAAILGNSISAAHQVPTSTPRYLVSSIGGPLNIFQSTSLTSGWTAVVGLTSRVSSWASNTTGSVVLSSDTANNVCKSTDGGITFGSCVAATINGTLTYAGGTNWLLAGGTVLRRSTNDGASWSTVHTSAANFTTPVCFAPALTVCIVPDDGGSVTRSTDSGATWPTIVDSGLGAPSNPAACDYGGGNAAVFNTRNAPVGFAAVTNDTHSSFNSGLGWFAGNRFGSHWDGSGVPGGSITCRNGRGFVAISTSGGGVNVFASYNPLIAPGGTLTSSAGGYVVAAPIQSGIILNTTPTTSGANAAAAVTFTNTAGSRICIRSITVFSSAAGAATLTITDGATVVRNFGTVVLGTSSVGTIFEGSPLVCSQTSNNLVVNIGAAGGGITTTTSVIGDRYPN